MSDAIHPRDACKAAKIIRSHTGFDKLLRTVIGRLQEKFLTTTTTTTTSTSTTSSTSSTTSTTTA